MKLKQALLCAALLLCVLALPAFAEAPKGKANITPEMTMGEIAANPSIEASGFSVYCQAEAEFPCEKRKTDRTKLKDYVHVCSYNRSAKALNLLIETVNAGVQVTYPLYTPEEIAESSILAEPKLHYFPGDGTKKKYVLVVGGNGSTTRGDLGEGMSTVWELHQMGYTVFLLHYRIFVDASNNAPLQDLKRAVRYITDHAEQFGVEPEQYAVVGYSSGGQLAGLLASEKYGYAQENLPKPGALLLGYPINDFYEGKLLYHFLMDFDEYHWRYYWTNISSVVTDDYPPVYHWYGKKDRMLFALNLHEQSPKLEQSLEKHQVPHEYRVFEQPGHGAATGEGTDADGWLNDAVAFWEAQTAV